MAVETIHGCVAESHVSDVYPCASSPFSKEVTSFANIMQQLYRWSKDFSVSRVAEEVGQVTVVDWFMRYLEICASYLLKTSQPWWARTYRRNRRVQVWHRKILCYNRWRLRDWVWVFGGIDCSTKEIFLVQVEDRSAADANYSAAHQARKYSS